MSSEVPAVVCPQDVWREAVGFLLGDEKGRERHCFALCGYSRQSGGGSRYLMRSLLLPGPGDIEDQAAAHVAPSAAYLARAITAVRRSGLALAVLHSHPASPIPAFSPVDDDADRTLAHHRRDLALPGPAFLSVVVGLRTLAARVLTEPDGEFNPVAWFRQVGPAYNFNVLDDHAPCEVNYPVLRYDRQLRFLGAEGQRDLAACTVAIAGLGGTGSLAAEQLARLGVGHFVLCDDDLVEEHNLNRLVGAGSADVGRPKVEIAQALIKAGNPRAEVATAKARVWQAPELFSRADVLFGCEDSDAGRQALNEIALRHVLPYIDFSTEIFLARDSHRMEWALAQCRVVVPGSTRCLACHEELDAQAAALERGESPVEEIARRAGYLSARPQTPTPSVIALNALIVSAGMIEFMKLFSGFAAPAAMLAYDALEQRLTRVSTERNPTCPACGLGGVLALGDLDPYAEELPRTAREDAEALWLAGMAERRRENAG